MTWVLFIFRDLEQKDLIKILPLQSIKQVAYLVGLKPSEVSNFYHSLILPRGLLKYCKLIQR